MAFESLLNLTWLIVLNQNVRIITCECPDPSVILPYGCTGCQYNYIECYGDNDFDLAQINTKVTEIKANTFMDIVFVEIYIDNSNLIHIHPDAFMDTYSTTDTLYIKNNPQLEPDTIYDVMSKFTNATFIEEYHNAKFTMMPANAFSNSKQSKLKRLHIWSSETTIGSHAINRLYSLRDIMFGAPVNHIMVNAFAIDRPINDSLDINLNYCWLNETSFEPGSLTVFHPFYMENELNTIDFKGTKGFDCQDCRFANF
ncbi:unnamed protein product [Medioppia subpectinata]|uniref:Uncharacterized protein n=1 Tax=Medioppia subpectinata TaxID=1979941 RepID=A0A7R9KFD6_9ACAR|nr:unnamed protein product [Medioppia subpectinata]CAG2102350.1 unnamed protein product [Medioppia subpectinata]